METSRTLESNLSVRFGWYNFWTWVLVWANIVGVDVSDRLIMDLFTKQPLINIL